MESSDGIHMMSTQDDNADGDASSHQNGVLNVTAKSQDELTLKLQIIKPDNATQQALLDLTSCLSTIQRRFPPAGLDLSLLVSILRLQPIKSAEESVDYQVLSILKQKLDKLISLRPEDLVQVFKYLADLCRIEAWRAPLGKAGYLQTAIDALTKDFISGDDERVAWNDLQRQALRLMGNMCADTDENRDRVLQYQGLQVVLSKFRDDQLASIAIPALFNICNDHDTAKEAAMESNLFERCLELLEKGKVKDTDIYSHLCLLLDIVCDKVDANDAPSNALDVILNASLDHPLEIEQRLSFSNLVNKLLALEANQKRLVLENKVDIVLSSFFRLFSEDPESMDVVLSGLDQTTSEEADEERDLKDVRTTMVTLLSEISSLPEFVKKNEVFTDSSTIVWKLRQILLSPLVPVSQAACLMLGNLACSDDVCIRMVRELKIHEAASTILRNASDMTLLHSALGLLRNLALPMENKENLAMAGIIENLQKWLMGGLNPQIQLAAASLLRQMINGSINNIQRLLLVSSSTKDDTISTQTQLAKLLKVYAKTDEVAIKTELARTVIAILRCVHSNDIDSQTKISVLADLYSSHEHLARPIIDMAIQSQYPVVRSEAWFGLGVMSRDAAGRDDIASNLDSKFLEALQSTVRGESAQDGHEQRDPAERTVLPLPSDNQVVVSKDRENALVMVHELLEIEGFPVLSDSVHDTLRRLLGSRPDEASRSSNR